jgi:hypothetical protein
MAPSPTALQGIGGVIRSFVTPMHYVATGRDVTRRSDLTSGEPRARPCGSGGGVWLHPGHGPMLMKLADRFNLVWCTTWGAEANTWIGPRIGYRLLPVLDWAAFGASAAPCLRKGRGDHQVVGGVVVCNGCQGCSVPFRHMTTASTLNRPGPPPRSRQVKAALYDPVLAQGRMYSRTVGGHR